MKVYTYNDKVLVNSANDKWLKKYVDPYNPLGLPANTVRVRTSDGNAPEKLVAMASYETATLVPGTTDVYDVYKSGNSFENLLCYSRNVIEILGANTTGITNMNYMLYACNLTTIPLFDTSKVTSMSYMFYDCTNVESGALAFYQQVSTQATPPRNHTETFHSCGSNTVTGAAELAQIPSSWGGTAS